MEAAGWEPGQADGRWRAWTRNGAELVASSHDGSVYRAEVVLDVWDIEDYGDFDDYSVIDLDAQVRYQHQVESVTAALGAPVVDGAPLVLDPGDDQPTDGIPTWFDCTWYALWPLP